MQVTWDMKILLQVFVKKESWIEISVEKKPKHRKREESLLIIEPNQKNMHLLASSPVPLVYKFLETYWCVWLWNNF